MRYPPPIACTLSAGEFKLRLAAIAELNAKSLRSVERDGLRLQLAYDRIARQEVEHMVNRERDCCAFLTFDIHERERQILVLVGAPEEARDAAALLFDQISSKSPTAAASTCGCDPK